jgi:hypothetical protein
LDLEKRQAVLAGDLDERLDGEKEPDQLLASSSGEQLMTTFIKEMNDKLTEASKRFKLTVKKKYVNEILLQSKGAQNLAQCVVLIVCDSALTSGGTYQ